MKRLSLLVLLLVPVAGCQDITASVRIVNECPVVRPTTGSVPLGCFYDAAGNLVGG